MKKIIPAKEIELCDICELEYGYLETCLFCGNRYCLMCKSVIAGCISPPRICKHCKDNRIVNEIVGKYAPLLLEILRFRDTELEVAGYEFWAPK